ncbi:hypothetical protein PQR11_18235 [Paraburkholderia strydomiana]|uniref:hypothetical protein n=1 Tax=Paraburkholderia strydomiana TaxID=1245417 RepID=UPI0038BA1FC5
MKPTVEFPDAIERKKRCFALRGLVVSDDDVVRGWSNYSDAYMPVAPPPGLGQGLAESSCEAFAFRSRAIGISVVTVVPVEDSHGHMYVPRPNDLTRAIGWAIGDTVEVTKSADRLELHRVTCRTDGE